MSTILDQTVTSFVNELFMGQCAHSKSEGDDALYYQSNKECLECATRLAVRFAAAQIAVGRRLEREERQAVAP